ncbi:unnamed protein product [Choristocarpus tenellus]
MKGGGSFCLAALCFAATVVKGRSCIEVGESGCGSDDTLCCGDIGLNQGTSCFEATCNAECSAVADYLPVPYPLTGDVTLTVPDEVFCDTMTDIHVTGGTLTIKGQGTNVNFRKIRFIVEDQGSIVFDIEETTFGPGSTDEEDSSGYTLEIQKGGSMRFTGDVIAKEVRDVRSVIGNYGELDFEKTTLFEENGNVIRANFAGNIRFGGNAAFIGNDFLAVSNERILIEPGNLESGFIGGTVTFEKKSYFEDNADNFNGVSGAAVFNCEQCTTIFKGKATFVNHNGDEGGAVANRGIMSFEKKAIFTGNDANEGSGGGVSNSGELTFMRNAVFKKNLVNNNGDGGALANFNDGTITFEGRSRFKKNVSPMGSGGAIINVTGGKIVFAGSDPIFKFNVASAGNCADIFNDDESTIEGFDGDICNLQ